MNQELLQEERRIVAGLVKAYFEIVPLDLRTYCSVTSEISKAVFEHFGIGCDLVPCQVWYSGPQKSYAIGFVGNPPTPNKWDGHVICSTRHFFIDAALHHFKVEFGIDVPPVLAGNRMTIATQVISQVNIGDKERVWWFYPPPKAALTLPQSPPELIAKHSSHLIDYLAGQFTR